MDNVPQRISLASQTAAILRDGLENGLWTDYLPGERSLCQRFNVSRPTLRQALNQLAREGRVDVAQGRPRRILAVSAAKRVFASKTVGLLTPVGLHAVPPFVLAWIDELRGQLARSGYTLKVQVTPGCYATRPFKALESLNRREACCAWVLYQAPEPMQRWFVQRRLPCVLAGSCFPGIQLPSVDIDYRAACRHATSWLLAHGHRRIAFIAREQRLGGDLESELGFRDAFGQSRCGEEEPLVVRHNDTVSHLCRQLDEVFKIRGDAPTALLVARTQHALTVVTHLLRRGWKIPGEVAVVSRDDDAFLDHVTPAVARYRSDAALFARKMHRLVRQLANNGYSDAPKPTRLVPQFVKADSLG